MEKKGMIWRQTLTVEYIGQDLHPNSIPLNFLRSHCLLLLLRLPGKSATRCPVVVVMLQSGVYYLGNISEPLFSS